MPIYNCDIVVPPPSCADCLDNEEHGRIRAVVFIAADSYDAIKAAPSTDAAWTPLLGTKVFVIPYTSGTYDGGQATEVPGFGDIQNRVGGKTHTLQINDPMYKDNCAFWNALSKSIGGYYVGYKTETQLHLSDAPVDVRPGAPVQDDVNSQIVWAVSIVWNNPESPCPVDAPPTALNCVEPVAP